LGLFARTDFNDPESGTATPRVLIGLILSCNEGFGRKDSYRGGGTADTDRETGRTFTASSGP